MIKQSMKFSSFTGWILLTAWVYYRVTNAQNISSTTGASVDNENGTVNPNSDIDFETLSLFGVTPEFAEQFRINLLKAIDAAREQEGEPPLRQGEFGGVNGGFYQGGGGGGGGGGFGPGGGGQEEEEEEEEDGPMVPTTPGPGAFGVLSGLFGIFSGLGTLSPSRIVQSTVNFFPPGQRMMAQMIVDSLIGYTPPENRTIRPRPRPRRTTTTPLPMSEIVTMPSETEAAVPTQLASNANETNIVAKGGESSNATSAVDPMSEVISAPEVTTTTEPDFINVHELLNRTTIPPPPPNEDDELDFEKVTILKMTPRPISNSTSSSYKLKPKATPEEDTPLNATEAIQPATSSATLAS